MSAMEASNAHKAINERRYADAAAQVHQALWWDPTNRYAEWIRRLLALHPEFHQAQDLAGEDRYDEAEEVMAALLRRFPSEPDLHIWLASMDIQRHAIDDSAEHAHRAAELAGDDPNVLYRAASAMRWGDPDGARRYAEHVKQLVELPEWRGEFRFGPELMNLEGILAFQQGHENLGLKLLEQAVAEMPEAISHAGDLAEAYMRLGRNQDALDVIARGLEHRPGDPRLVRLREEAERGLP